MTTMSNISKDLLEEILSRFPLTCLRAVRSTCKLWNDISKDQSFTKKFNKENLMIMIRDHRACLVSVKFHGIHNQKDLVDPFIKQIGTLNQVEIIKVFHCNGLLLCLTKADKTGLMVWNPYLGKTRWIQPLNKFYRFDRYGIGYDNNNNNNHKILRFFYSLDHNNQYEIYDFMSNSWRVLDITTELCISFCCRGVSLKGNTYFIAHERLIEMGEFLLCFDFTSERFGLRLHLPFNSYNQQDYVVLSTVREEKLAVLFKRCDAYETQIWITTKIEPNAVLWSNFLKFDFEFDILGGSFFVDEEEKVAVIFSIDREKSINNTAHMIGEDGYYKDVVLGKSKYCPFVCSYVPSWVQIQ